MSKIIPVNRFEIYYNNLIKKSDFINSAFIDSNIVISAYDEDHSFNPSTMVLLDLLTDKDFNLYTSVIVRSEVLNYFRKQYISKIILEHDILNKVRPVLKDKIENYMKQHDILSEKLIKDLMSDFKIKYTVWKELCKSCINDPINKIYDLLISNKDFTYKSPQDDPDLFTVERIPWDGAKDIIATTGIGSADAMIINIFNYSKSPFIVTNDLDIAYAILCAHKINKDVLTSEDQYKKLKKYGFPDYYFF